VAYGCTTCIGNAGRWRPTEEAIAANDLVCAAVLSGNRNFEARIHPPSRPTSSPRRRWWWPTPSPARVLKDLMREPLGRATRRPGSLDRDIWPTAATRSPACLRPAMDPKSYRSLYAD
jgi:aconitate hydratase